MRKALVLVVTCLLSLAYTFSQATSSEQEKKNTNVVVEWRNGLTIQSADNSFRMQVGGKLHNDWAFQEGDQQITGLLGELEDGTEFRRARLSMSGLMYEWVEFKMQVDFATGDLFFRDVYAGLRDLRGIGNIRIGQFKEPFGLEEQTSASYIPFMERSLANALVPSRNTGVMIHNRQFNERASWAVGVFKDTDDFGAGTSDEDYAITGRVTGLPWFENEGRRLLHLGVAYSRRNTADFARFQQRPEAHLS
ncbi:MAG TPA: porin, partial [Acidobacteriota bacterium]|nr:porin [Acidobacteriota bacterium]